MIPAALTSRCTSTQLVAASAQGAFPAGGGPDHCFDVSAELEGLEARAMGMVRQDG
jgi:hypothetical protein